MVQYVTHLHGRHDMTSVRSRRTVAVVGLGAAGTLVGMRLCDLARRRGLPLDLLLIDPAPEAGRGGAYATRDPRHRLNVPAGNMSCCPDDPDHFVRWLCRHGGPSATAADFATRYQFGCYLGETLGRAIASAAGTVSARRLRSRAVECRWTDRPAGATAQLVLEDGRIVEADGVVLATGPAPSTTAWLPSHLQVDERFIADPWSPGALEPVLAARAGQARDVLLVGSGLTAVDVALALDTPDRTVQAVSRNGRLPAAHAVSPLPPEACAEPLDGLPISGVRAAILRHIAKALRTHGDWRPAVDGLRPLSARVWASLSTAERAEFVRRDASLWNNHRHRMPPATAEAVARMRRATRLRVSAGSLTSACDGPDGSLDVTLRDGRRLSVGWVVNCTGPGSRLADSADPLWRGLLDSGDVVPGPLGMGASTDRGRVLGADGRCSRALWTLGAPRRGELWETTAIPEIRSQAAAVAEAALS